VQPCGLPRPWCLHEARGGQGRRSLPQGEFIHLLIFLLHKAVCNHCAHPIIQAIAGACGTVNSAGSSGETVTDLVRAVRDEDIRVHINVQESVRASHHQYACLRLRVCVCSLLFCRRLRSCIGLPASSQVRKPRTTWQATTPR